MWLHLYMRGSKIILQMSMLNWECFSATFGSVVTILGWWNFMHLFVLALFLQGNMASNLAQPGSRNFSNFLQIPSNSFFLSECEHFLTCFSYFLFSSHPPLVFSHHCFFHVCIEMSSFLIQRTSIIFLSPSQL